MLSQSRQTAHNQEANAMSDEVEIETLIQTKGLNAPRITPKDLDDAMLQARDVQYHRFPGTSVVVCCVVLANGFSLVGKAAAVSMETFDLEVGKEVAYKDAREQLWVLLGYKLRERLSPSVAVAA
jgi:hypothetical protein